MHVISCFWFRIRVRVRVSVTVSARVRLVKLPVLGLGLGLGLLLTQELGWLNLPQLGFGLGSGLWVGVVRSTGYFMLKVKFQESGPLLTKIPSCVFVQMAISRHNFGDMYRSMSRRLTIISVPFPISVSFSSSSISICPPPIQYTVKVYY